MRGGGPWRQAWRSLLRARSFTLGAVLTLGLGVGVTATAFSVVRGVLLKPLPHRGGESLVYLRQAAPGAAIENVYFSVPEIDDYRAGVPSFSAVAEFSSMRFTALDLDRPREVEVGVVTGNYFEVMGLGTTLGRPLGREDDGEDTDPVAVLTDAAWRGFFGGDPDVVGRTFRMRGRTVTVVGVAERHPPYPERTDMYVNMVTSPHHLDATMNHDRTHRMTEVFARLAPGRTLDEARVEVAAVAHRGRTQHPEAYEAGYGFSVSASTLKDQLARRARSIVWVMAATAFLVLLVALANVANLILTRAVRLRRELAVRVSLGASAVSLRGRLLRENMLLGTLGALLGSVLAFGGSTVLAAYVGRFSVRAGEITVDPPVLALVVVLGVGAGALLSYLPALPSDDDAGTLRSRGGTGVRRAQELMVMGQVAASLVMVFGAGLLARTLLHLQEVDTGMHVEQVLALDVPAVRNGRTPGEIRDDYLEMERRIRDLPEVSSVSLTNTVPLRSGGFQFPWTVDVYEEGRPLPPGEIPHRADLRTVTPEYFETLGMSVLGGRGLAWADDSSAPLAVVVNESFARRLLSTREATLGNVLGRRVRWGGDFVRFMGLSDGWFTVVGVVSDIREQSARQVPAPTAYVPHLQAPYAASLLVRTDGDPALLARAVERAVHSVEPDQPVEAVATLGDLRDRSLGGTRLNAQLVGLLAVFSLIIAVLGVFASLAFNVSRRTREIGIRMALGADGSRVTRTVMLEALGVVATGVAVGGVTARLLSGSLRELLYGVPAGDPLTLLGAAVLMLAAGGGAALFPALRAARTDPARILGDAG